jgi:Mce-associated membrane protein
MSAKSEPEKPVTSKSSEPKPYGVPEDPPADQAKASRSKVLPLVLGGLCLVLAVVVALLGVWAITDASARKVDEAAVEAAKTSAPLVLSYAPATVNQDIETARKQLTGKFAADFDQLVNQVVLPATKQQGLTSKCTTAHAALTDTPSAEPDGRDVLVIMQQEVTGPNAQGQKGLIQVKVTVVKTPEGEWKVSFLQPV